MLYEVITTSLLPGTLSRNLSRGDDTTLAAALIMVRTNVATLTVSFRDAAGAGPVVTKSTRTFVVSRAFLPQTQIIGGAFARDLSGRDDTALAATLIMVRTNIATFAVSIRNAAGFHRNNFV